MRIHEGDLAYDIEEEKDPLTHVRRGWTYKIFQIHPFEKLLARGQGKTRAEVEQQALTRLRQLEKTNRKSA